ncbi:hypothetical protein GOM49_03405 [Clostridium bovifaecis]|uniref:Uncharacterized protein n=1 Tax=Clostridium bovifaecis TaxID=2184719 RepID=A0A6I6EKU0_9CLOT|nr:hypothetical protein GOM49_03405 [Clostridium bovifaecis]
MDTNWEEMHFNKIFEETYNSLKYAVDNSCNYTIENLKGLLQNLYVQQGNNQLGRGEAMDISVDAQIAACETLLAEYKGKLS